MDKESPRLVRRTPAGRGVVNGGVAARRDVLDIAKVFAATFTPPAISLVGAVAAARATEELVHVAPQELLSKAAALAAVYVLASVLQVAVAAFALCVRPIYSRRARRLAPWLLAAGLAASLASTALYASLISLFNESWWRRVLEFALFGPMYATYLTASRRWLKQNYYG